MPGRKDWDPRGPYGVVHELQELARQTIGDGKEPNLFFVTVEGRVVVVSQDFTVAYRAWRAFSTYPYQNETGLEDRLTGVLASVEPGSEEPGARLIKIDDTAMFGHR